MSTDARYTLPLDARYTKPIYDEQTLHIKNLENTSKDFGWALDYIRSSVTSARRVRRSSWAVNEFIFVVKGSQFKVNRPPLLGIYPEGTEITYHPHIDMKCASGVVVPWVPNQVDLFARDWMEYIDYEYVASAHG